MAATSSSRAKSTTPAGNELPEEFLRLRHLIPLRRLADEEFHTVMQSAELEHLATGDIFFESGIDDRSMFYLLEGTITIEGDNNDRFTLTGGSIETAHPLSPHPRARRLATANSTVVFVRLPLELLQIEKAGAEGQTKAGLEVEEIDADFGSTDKRIIFSVYHALMDGSFNLPTLPDIALKIRRAASDPTKGIDDITRIAQTDPAVAAYCIRMSNNAAYAGASRISGVRDAVVRMGAKTTADLITAYTLRELYTAPDAMSQVFMQAAWRHSARIAALSHVIADRSKTLNPEQALLGGLLHDIGMLIVIREWHEQAKVPLKTNALRELGRELNGSLGSMVLRNWKLPDSIVTAALESEHWSRNAGPTLDICDCIALAHAHDDAPPPWSLDAPQLEQIAAFNKLPDSRLCDDSSRLAIVQSAQAELNQLDKILKS